MTDLLSVLLLVYDPRAEIRKEPEESSDETIKGEFSENGVRAIFPMEGSHGKILRPGQYKLPVSLSYSLTVPIWMDSMPLSDM